MRNIFIVGVLSAILTLTYSTVGATVVDSSLVGPMPVSAPNFTLQTFASCGDMQTKVGDFMEDYYTANPPYFSPYIKWRPMPMMMEWAPTVSAPASLQKSTDSSSGGDREISETNTRTAWVDEPEKVKTDGKYLYVSRIEDKNISIFTADDTLTLVTKILLPDEWISAEIFLSGNRLVVVGSKSIWREEFRNSWIDRGNKTMVVVYDISTITKPRIERYSQVDGIFREARIIDGQLTLLSTTNFNFPYDRYFPQVDGTKLELDMKKLEREFSTSNVLPKRIDFIANSRTADLGGALSQARRSGLVRERDVADCASISYVLPDAETLKNHQFNPSFTTITNINLNAPRERVRSNVLFGDVGQAYLSSKNNLYITATLYTSTGWNCPRGAMCAMRWVEPGSQTLIHKFVVGKRWAIYDRTGLVPGNLVTDYAIDESSVGDVRLVTQKTGESRESLVTILSSNLSLLGQVGGFGVGENFQSARFMGNRLYLVTFQQIDPFYVVDIADSKNPKKLGELKIPGYSTYLHPYDENHLIGIGYDTITNEWGGTQNAGVKVDLYDVKDVTKPTQKSTLTLGGVGSSSEALSNPRLFVWQKSRNTLYLPAMLYTPGKDPKNLYRYSDVFQGVVALKINPTEWVKELGRISHLDSDTVALEAERKKECAQYVPQIPKCNKIIGGGEYCEPVYNYVPTYCYADASIGEYKASRIWQYSESFIDRSMFRDNRLFTLSRSQIQSRDIDQSFIKKGERKLEILNPIQR